MTTMTGEEHASRKGDFQARDFMTSTIVHEFIQMIEDETQSRPTPVEFEMAYQARVAIDRIRFAINQTEQFGPQTDRMREAGLQLLDALERLELVDRRFQQRSRHGSARSIGDGIASHVNGSGASGGSMNGA
jgi:hypothetical protein